MCISALRVSPALFRLAAPIVLACLVGAAASAQIPDTTTASRYLPLAVGNEWHTSGSYSCGYPFCDEYWRTREVVLSAVAGAPGHFNVERTHIFSRPGSSSTTSTTTFVRYYDAATDRVVGAETPCPLGAPYGTSVVCGDRTYSVSGGPGQSVTVGSQTVPATRKQYAWSGPQTAPPNGESYVYAAGIGPVSYDRWTHNGVDYTSRRWSLSYARVGSQEYGQQLFPSAGEPAAAAGAPALSPPVPNPTAGGSVLTLDLPDAALVTVAVYDALGRRVHVLADRLLGEGPHPLRIAPGTLAAGTYVVRAAVGTRVLAQRLTIVR